MDLGGKVIAHKCPKCHGRGYEHKRVKLEIKDPGRHSIWPGRVVLPSKGERGVPMADLMETCISKSM